MYIARHPLLRLAGSYWVVNESVSHADIIIVLGDDDYRGDRAAKAAELFHEGIAPEVVASGRWLRPYASVADMMAVDLEKDGVPQGSVIKFSNQAGNIEQEAQALRGLIQSHGWSQIVVVTSNYGTRRARFVCQRIFPHKVSVRVVSAPDTNFDPSGWWRTRLGEKLFLNEIFGYIVARWELRHGDVPDGDPASQTFLQPGQMARRANLATFTLPYPLGNNLDLQACGSVL